jgi:hypothetical protein
MSQLQKENEELKSTQPKVDPIFEELAQSYGYTDVEKFKEDYQESVIKKKAEAQGVNPEHYKMTLKQAKEIEELKRINAEQIKETRLQLFKNSVDSVISSNELPDSVKTDLFDRLEAKGYSIESLLDAPDFEYLITGALSDKILEIKQQKQLEKEKKKSSIADEVVGSSPINSNFDLDKFIQDKAKSALSNS